MLPWRRPQGGGRGGPIHPGTLTCQRVIAVVVVEKLGRRPLIAAKGSLNAAKCSLNPPRKSGNVLFLLLLLELCHARLQLGLPFREQLMGFREHLAAFREHLAAFREHLAAFRGHLTAFREHFGSNLGTFGGFQGTFSGTQETFVVIQGTFGGIQIIFGGMQRKR